MNLKVILLIMRLTVTILSISNAVNANNDSGMIWWIVAAVCWGACSVLDILDIVNSRT